MANVSENERKFPLTLTNNNRHNAMWESGGLAVMSGVGRARIITNSRGEKERAFFVLNEKKAKPNDQHALIRVRTRSFIIDVYSNENTAELRVEIWRVARFQDVPNANPGARGSDRVEKYAVAYKYSEFYRKGTDNPGQWHGNPERKLQDAIIAAVNKASSPECKTPVYCHLPDDKPAAGQDDRREMIVPFTIAGEQLFTVDQFSNILRDKEIDFTVSELSEHIYEYANAEGKTFAEVELRHNVVYDVSLYDDEVAYKLDCAANFSEDSDETADEAESEGSPEVSADNNATDNNEDDEEDVLDISDEDLSDDFTDEEDEAESDDFDPDADLNDDEDEVQENRNR